MTTRASHWSLGQQVFALQGLLCIGILAVVTLVFGYQIRRDAVNSRHAMATALAQTLVGQRSTHDAAASRDPERMRAALRDASSSPRVIEIVLTSTDGTAVSVGHDAGRRTAVVWGEAVGSEGSSIAGVRVGIAVPPLVPGLPGQLRRVVGIGCLVVAVTVVGNSLIGWRIRRYTHGMGTVEITRMFEYYNAVLHSTREGVLIIDNDGRLQLANDEARRLLGTDLRADGQPVSRCHLPATLEELILSRRSASDEIHVARDAVLVVNQSTAYWDGVAWGSVATLRDQTELQDLIGELHAVRSLADSLQSQAHEFANRMHMVITMIELGEHDSAVEFVTREVFASQQLMDQLISRVDEPVLAALLLGKVGQAAERGVDLVVRSPAPVCRTGIRPGDLVTIAGNLIDNAIDAAASSPRPRVEVSVGMSCWDDEGERLLLTVIDTGPGLETEDAFGRGWTTKGGPEGHGLGLSLLAQAVRRNHGSLSVRRVDDLTVADVELPLHLCDVDARHSPGQTNPGVAVDV